MIELCRKEDIPQVAALYDKVTAYLELHVNYPHWRHGIYPAYDYVVDSCSHGMLYAVKQGGRVVGAFTLGEDPQGKYDNATWQIPLQMGQYVVLHALAIDPDYTRQGLAKEALSFVIHHARLLGYKAIRLDVVPGHTPGKKLYESVGFVYLGDVDLERGFEDIPVFSMYELVL